MRKIYISSVLAIALIVGFALLSISCATVNTQGKILASTVLTVDAAVKGWHTWAVLGNSTVDQDRVVETIYLKYQAVETIAEKALIASIKTEDKSIFAQANIQLEAVKGELLNAIALFKKGN